jgi:hypothetical protein
VNKSVKIWLWVMHAGNIVTVSVAKSSIKYF